MQRFLLAGFSLYFVSWYLSPHGWASVTVLFQPAVCWQTRDELQMGNVKRTCTAGEKWCFPCFFTGKQDKEQEAESFLGICGLNLEARNGLSKRQHCFMWFFLWLQAWSLYQWNLDLPLCVPSCSSCTILGCRRRVAVHKIKKADSSLYKIKQLHSCPCWWVSNQIFPKERTYLLCCLLSWWWWWLSDSCGPRDYSACIQALLLTGKI